MSGRGASSTSTPSRSGGPSRMRERRPWPSRKGRGEERRSSRRGLCEDIPRGRSISRSTCGSPEPDALLVLVVPGPLGVRLLGGRRQVLEDDLRERLADREGEVSVRIRVVRDEGQGDAEAGGHLAEGPEEPLAGPRRPPP